MEEVIKYKRRIGSVDEAKVLRENGGSVFLYIDKGTLGVKMSPEIAAKVGDALIRMAWGEDP